MARLAADNADVLDGDEPEGTDLAEPAPPDSSVPASAPHPSTLGWDERAPDSGLASSLEPKPLPSSGQDRAWEVVPEPEGSLDWSDGAPGRSQGDAAAFVWSELEDERRLLPPGRTLVGRQETLRLVGVHTPPLLARLDTGRVRSVLHAELLESGPDTVRVRLGSTVAVLPRASEAFLAVSVTLGLGAAELPVVLRLEDPTDGEPVVLGCDVLAGHFVVDPGRP